MLVRYMLCLSVCLSIASQCYIKTAKHIQSRRQCHTIADWLWFSDAKDIGDISMGWPSTAAPNAGGRGKIAFFDRSSPLWLRCRIAEDLRSSAMSVWIGDGALAEQYSGSSSTSIVEVSFITLTAHQKVHSHCRDWNWTELAVCNNSQHVQN